MTAHLRIALAQVTAGADLRDICAAARDKAADVLVFPEMFSNGYSRFDPNDATARADWIAAAVALDSGYVRKFQAAARDFGLAIVATFLEKAEPKPFNSAVLIDASGAVVLHQRKRHICFFDAPEEACGAGESSAVARLRLTTGEVVVGLMICMDREYPEVATDLVRQGVELILIPNSCRLVDDPTVGDVRVAGVRALAFQTVTGIALANYPAPKDDGHSLAVDPLGRIIAMAGDQPDILIAEFDLDQIRAVQAEEWFRRSR